MRTLHESLRVAQLVVFTLLAVAALLTWRRRPGATQAWLAATLCVLGAVVVAGRFLPEEGMRTPAELWVTKGAVAVLVLFPYLLFQFAASLRRPARILALLAHAFTAVCALGIFFFDSLPLPGQPRSRGFQVYLLVLVTQWVLLSVAVALTLWRSGKGQPTVARFRMRTLSLAAIGMSAAVVVAVGPSEGRVGARQIVAQILGLLSGPLFLLGFAPPRFVLALWRRREAEEFREAERGLMSAATPEDVATVVLPHAANIVGGRISVLVAADGSVTHAFGASKEQATQMLAESGSAEDPSGGALRIPMEEGGLVVLASPYTPYFGRDEAEALGRLALLTSLALARSALLAGAQQSAQALHEANESLLKTNEAIGEFVAIASHDLRTPITVIQGFTSMLSARWDDLPDDDKKQFIATIDRQTRHLSSLANDLLLVSQIDASALTPRPRRLDLRAHLDRLLEGFPDHRQEIVVRVPHGTAVLADPDHTQRMLGNYLSNAINYGEPPVEIETRSVNGSIDVMVSDHGNGVPVDFVPLLFGKFARADKTASKSRMGTGLGLSIVRGLANAAGGDAWYEPNHPHGSRFVVRLPAAKGGIDGIDG